jgi:hypothetical protein
MLAIARALIRDPKLILLDEAFLGAAPCNAQPSAPTRRQGTPTTPTLLEHAPRGERGYSRRSQHGACWRVHEL